MRKLLIVLLLVAGAPAFGTTWYAAATGNMNSVAWWSTQGSSCAAGSGTQLTWGSQANGDTFDANGCTVAVNVDPGSATVEVTLESDATNGGGFTYATATNITIHANITGTKTTALTITGSTGGGTIVGNVTSSATSGVRGVTDTHTAVTITLNGNVTGDASYGYNYGASSGALVVNGNGTTIGGTAGVYSAGSGTSSITVNGTCTGDSSIEGCENAGTGSFTVTGACEGSNTWGVLPGCLGNGSTYPITVTGNIINGLYSPGATGYILFTPVSTGYVLSPANSSYTLGTINANAMVMPTNPGAGDVLSGVSYGPYTGTLSASGSGLVVTGGW